MKSFDDGRQQSQLQVTGFVRRTHHRALRTCFEIQNLVAKRLQLLPLPREIALYQHSDFAGERDGVRGNRISKHVLRKRR